MKTKKRLMFLVMALLVINVFSSSILASDVAYIYKNRGQIDRNIIDVFEELGLEVDLISERRLPNDLSDYKFVFVGDERFRNIDRIRIWETPTIISNYFFGEEWGLTDDDGVSRLAASSPLSVKKDDEVIRVYTRASFDSSTVGIPYYYLADNNRDVDLAKIASPYTNNGEELGAVISYGSPGINLMNGEITRDNICFFGVIESNYWTEEARELFKGCVEFVGVTCNENSDCPDEAGNLF